MKRWMLGLLAVLFSTTLAAAQQQPPTPVMPQPGEIPDCGLRQRRLAG